jgi:hypothetical protein
MMTEVMTLARRRTLAHIKHQQKQLNQVLRTRRSTKFDSKKQKKLDRIMRAEYSEE